VVATPGRMEAAAGGLGWAGSLGSGDREPVGWERVAGEDGDTLVIEREFRGLPGEVGGVERFGLLCVCPADEGGHPDRLEGFDVVGRIGGRRDVEDALPHAVEAQKELDFFGSGEGAADLHEALAAGADEGILTPDAQDEIAPEGAEGPGALARRRGDGLRLAVFLRVVPRLGPHSAALVGVAAAT